ncbi:Hypothetical protein Cp106_1387 [Corynebacterium pseudotuberculosis 1/06-A]|nr:Hypothetical protein Cp106_1387 [Corynebacterium pseudotuberculosis 1/06-A]
MLSLLPNTHLPIIELVFDLRLETSATFTKLPTFMAKKVIP